MMAMPASSRVSDPLRLDTGRSRSTQSSRENSTIATVPQNSQSCYVDGLNDREQAIPPESLTCRYGQTAKPSKKMQKIQRNYPTVP